MIKSTEHFSFTVSNLEDALHFFGDLLGLKTTPPAIVEKEEIQKIVGMPDSRLKISLIDLPDGAKIELIEYLQPQGAKVDLTTCNYGVAHIAFNVDDIQKMYEELSAKGVEFVSEPVLAPGNDGKGRWAVCYLKGPDGITFELIEKFAK